VIRSTLRTKITRKLKEAIRLIVTRGGAPKLVFRAEEVDAEKWIAPGGASRCTSDVPPLVGAPIRPSTFLQSLAKGGAPAFFFIFIHFFVFSFFMTSWTYMTVEQLDLMR
jgi:hypothetical protein